VHRSKLAIGHAVRGGAACSGERRREDDVNRGVDLNRNDRPFWHVNPPVPPSQYDATLHPESYTLTCGAPDGTVPETTTVEVARGTRSLCTHGGVGGTVPATLGLTLTLKVKASSPAAGMGSAFTPLAATPTSLLAWAGPVSHDPVTVAFR
jgi:hypothetical protein